MWKEKERLQDVVEAGCDALINNAFGEGNWYLDHLDTSWRDVYDNKPCSDLSPAMCRKVLGGHGQTWGETVDGSDLI